MEDIIVPFSPKNGNKGCMIGKEIQVEYVTQLQSVKFFITDYGIPDTSYSYGVLKFLDEIIIDGILCENTLNSNDTCGKGNLWVENQFERTVTLLPGKYLLYMKWDTPPNNQGDNTQAIGFKEEQSSKYLSWMNWSGNINDWHKDTGPYKGNFMIEPTYVSKLLSK